MKRSSQHQKGFTLIEIMLSLLLVAIVASIAYKGFAGASSDVDAREMDSVIKEIDTSIRNAAKGGQHCTGIDMASIATTGDVQNIIPERFQSSSHPTYMIIDPSKNIRMSFHCAGQYNYYGYYARIYYGGTDGGADKNDCLNLTNSAKGIASYVLTRARDVAATDNEVVKNVGNMSQFLPPQYAGTIGEDKSSVEIGATCTLATSTNFGYEITYWVSF